MPEGTEGRFLPEGEIESEINRLKGEGWLEIEKFPARVKRRAELKGELNEEQIKDAVRDNLARSFGENMEFDVEIFFSQSDLDYCRFLVKRQAEGAES